MRIERVEVQGFRSFKNLETFDFNTSAGVILLTGRNEDEPLLGANGAGKSSLWEAVCWCLYGATSTGLKGPEVATWTSGTGVYVLVCINGRRILRTWREISLKIDGEDATQDDVDAFVGLTREQFLFCAYIAQHSPSFLDLSAAARTDLLSSVLRLDTWLVHSETASKYAQRYAKEAEETALKHARVLGSIKDAEENDYTSLDAAWQRKRLLAIDMTEEQFAEAFKEYTKYFSERVGSSDRLHRIKDEVLRRRNDAYDVADKQFKNVRVLSDRIVYAEHILKGNPCPTCGQPVPPRERVTRSMLREYEREHSRCQRAQVDADAALHALEVEFDAAQQSCADVDARARESQSALSRAVERLEECARRAQAALSARSPYETLIAERDERLAKLRTSEKRLQAALVEVRGDRDNAAYWVKGFKDVRLFLVAEAMGQLEVEVNSALHDLGLHDWLIRFAPDAETKAGGVKRGFTVMIESPTNERPVPWAVWSGGEAQRLRLATTLGLSNLISDYTGFAPFVEVWDEPSTGMQSIEDMLETFAHRAQGHKRQVWVIDHRAPASGVFIATVTAVKQAGSTTIERNDYDSAD